MVELLVKRLLVVGASLLLLLLALAPLEDKIRSSTPHLENNGLLEHRSFYAVDELYQALDDVEMSDLKFYLFYQFVDFLRGLLSCFFRMDLLTFGLRHVPSLAALDLVPFISLSLNMAENFCLLIFIAAWPIRFPSLAKALVGLTSLLSLVDSFILLLIGLSAMVLLVLRRFGPPPLATAASRASKQD